MKANPNPPLLFIPVSKLCRYDFCGKASKLLLFDKPKYGKGTQNTYLMVGTKMHSRYSRPYKTFYRRVFIHNLEHRHGHVLSRAFGMYAIRGIPDDYIVSSDGVVSVIELKTTNKSKVIGAEVRAFAFQLQLYIWILEPILEEMGYRLADEHYIEVMSQRTGKIKARIAVYREKNMEKRLKYIFDSFNGQEKMTVPPYKQCKYCTKPVKNICDWYQKRRKK